MILIPVGNKLLFLPISQSTSSQLCNLSSGWIIFYSLFIIVIPVICLSLVLILMIKDSFCRWLEPLLISSCVSSGIGLIGVLVQVLIS